MPPDRCYQGWWGAAGARQSDPNTAPAIDGKKRAAGQRERECPNGQEPIAWYLVTNEPIETAERIAAIVDAHCARWKRQLESYDAP